MTIIKDAITFRLATTTDIAQIAMLNFNWLQENLVEEQRINGFLTCDQFSNRDLQEMIKEGEIAVAVTDNKIVAYYLFDNNSGTNSLKLITEIINDLHGKGILRETNLAKRAQVVIDTSFQKTGLYKPLIHFLHEHLSNKYNSVFSIVYKDNPKIRAHIRVGWKIVSEDSERYFLIHNLG